MQTMLTLKKDDTEEKRLSTTSTFNAGDERAEVNQKIYNALIKVGVSQEISEKESKRNQGRQ